MSGELIDIVLSGVIILLLIAVIWKWLKGHGSCGESTMILACGCKNGRCCDH